MRYGFTTAWLTSVVMASASLAAEPDANQTLASLHAVLAKNVGHAREWLEQSDYKSVERSASGLQFLAELIKARSDDAPWQAALGNVVSAAGDVKAASRSEDLAKCKATLA